MEVKLDKRYPVAAPVEQCWRVLGDVRAVAACMPGAQITEQLDDTHFKGSVKSRVGPAVMSFNGDIELQGRDEAAKSLRLLGKGADKAGSSASMQLTAHLEAGEGDASVLVGTATIVVSGKLAQFGSRLLVPVSDAMLAQFADNFRAAAAAAAAAPVPDTAPVPGAAAGAAGPAAASVPASEATATQASATTTSAPASAPSSAPSSASATATARSPAGTPVSRTPPPPPAPVRELNALALMWTVLKDLLAGLFRRKR